MKYDKTTRWLHAGIALGISIQMFLSLVMEHPSHGKPVGGLPGAAFDVHENLGMAMLTLLVLHWVWQLSGHTRQGLGHLFPWLSTSRRADLWADLKRLAASRFKDIPEVSPLAGAIHGLGILTATAMALSGGVLYFGLGGDGTASPTVHAVEEFHSFMATFMWIYLGGHVAIAALHQWLGHRVLSDMFNLSD